MELEAIILSKIAQEQKTKQCMFSLISGSSTMRTHEHREGSITHRGRGPDRRWGERRGRASGQIVNKCEA